jgi:hypothetical protein
MAVPGSNLKYSRPQRVLQHIFRKMGLMPGPFLPRGTAGRVNSVIADAGTSATRKIGICVKAGAVATNQTNDQPTGVGDLCWDSTNDDVWRCTGYTSTTVFTWTKIVD